MPGGRQRRQAAGGTLTLACHQHQGGHRAPLRPVPIFGAVCRLDRVARGVPERFFWARARRQRPNARGGPGRAASSCDPRRMCSQHQREASGGGTMQVRGV